MRILVNTRLFKHKKTDGISRFMAEILPRLVRQRAGDEFIFLFDRPFSKKYTFDLNVKAVFFPLPTINSRTIEFWFDYVLPLFVRYYRPHIVFSPDGFIHQKVGQERLINTVHDVNFLSNPQWIPMKFRKFYTSTVPRYIRSSDTIITVSHFSKQEIIKFFPEKKDNICVVYNGLTKFHTTSLPSNIKIKLQKPFFLYAGSLHERKNISNTIKAFLQFNQSIGNKFLFVLAGKQFFEKTALTYPDVMFIENPSDDILAGLYQQCMALVNFSFYEGFGLPVIEAMQYNKPLLLSDIPDFREITSGYAIFSDPYSIDSMKIGFEQIIQNEITSALIKQYPAILRNFDWDIAAQKINKIFEHVK